MQRSQPSTAALFALGLACMIATLAAMLALPHTPYVRWQSTRVEAFARLGWVYERLHYDPTPIDIAFIGTSHTMNGIDGAAVAQRLAASGLRDASGRCLTVTNFAIPSYGRNLQWLIARELLTTHRPKLLVIEIFENETRKAHPYFANAATVGDVFGAPALINQNFAEDIVRMPWRQVSLAVESLDPASFGLKSAFRASDYDGSTVDNTRIVNVGGVAYTPLRDRVASGASLDAHVRQVAAAKDLHILGKRFEEYEYAVPRRYYGAILALAKARGVPVKLLYLPSYGQRRDPVLLDGLGADKPVITVPQVLADRSLWYDPEHLNLRGASRLTDRVAEALAPVSSTVSNGGTSQACAFGFPPRPAIKPFRPRG